MSAGKQQSLKRLAAFLVIDSICIFAAYVAAAYVVDFGVELTLFEKARVCLPYLVIFLALWVASSLSKEGLGTIDGEDMPSYAIHVTKTVADSLIVCVVVLGLFSEQGVIRQFLLAFGVGVFIVIVGCRVLTRLGLWGARLRGLTMHRVLIIGANERSETLLRIFTTREHLGYRVCGLLDDDEVRGRALVETYNVRYLGTTDAFQNTLDQERPSEVFIAVPIRSFYSRIQEIAEMCEQRDIAVKLVADLFPLRIATNRLMYVEDIPLLSLSAVPEEQARLAMKRAVDFAVSSVLLAALAIPLAIVAIIIKLDSPGPIFFAQERVGQNQRRFKMLKFRSMIVNAEAHRAELEAQNEADGPVFKIRRDPRVTRVGRYIRKYSIDEFPQLINVWRGEMSLVGPRPPIASEVDQYSWDQRRRLSVKPGMTGLWQISGRSDIGFAEWVRMDLEYIDSWSLSSDFVILLKTFRAVVQGRGAA